MEASEGETMKKKTPQIWCPRFKTYVRRCYAVSSTDQCEDCGARKKDAKP